MNVNPYAAIEEDPFAEMAGLISQASADSPTASENVTSVPVPKTLTPTPADYYASQLTQARALFSDFELTIKEKVNAAKALKVESPEEEQEALSLGLPLDRLYKRIEEARVSFVDQPNKYVKAINNLANHYKALIDDGRQTVKRLLGGYARQKALEAQRRAIEEQKAREQARIAAEAEAAKLKEEAQIAGLKAPEISLPPPVEAAPPLVEKTVISAEGKATAVKTWKFEVTDPQQVPREYLSVDEKKIRAAVKDGIRSIPGVNIYEDNDIRFSS